MVLFSSTKYIVSTILLGSKAAVGTLYVTNDFLRPLHSYPHSIAGSTDIGKFWYIGAQKKMFLKPGFAEYPFINVVPGYDIKNRFQDRYFAGDILKGCFENAYTRNYISNKRKIKKLLEWCTIDNDYLTEDFLQVFRWEFTTNCKVLWKTLEIEGDYNSQNIEDAGWFLPYVLERVWRERDEETLDKLKKIPKFIDEQIKP